jgi:hypothetical protein
MKARLLKKWGTHYAGQVLTNVQDGSIPAGVAEFYEDDDPAVNTVVEQSNPNDPLMVINDEINPETAKTHDEAQRAKADNSRAADKQAVVSELEEQERKDTQRRARDADEFAAKRGKADDSTALTASQKEKLRAGKEHGRGTSTATATDDEPTPRKGKGPRGKGRAK